MIVLIGKENLIDLSTYFVKLENNIVVSKVWVHSAQDCKAYRDRLAALLASNDITQFYYNELIKNTHTGVKKNEYSVIDTDIDNSKLNIEEMVQYLLYHQIKPPFLPTDSIEVAIQKTEAKGYYLNRNTMNNQYD